MYVTHNYLTLQLSLQQKLRYLSSDEGMTCLDKLRQAHVVAALNTREAFSKQNRGKYGNIPQYKIGDSILITILIRNQIGMKNTYQISES